MHARGPRSLIHGPRRPVANLTGTSTGVHKGISILCRPGLVSGSQRLKAGMVLATRVAIASMADIARLYRPAYRNDPQVLPWYAAADRSPSSSRDRITA